MAGSFEFKQFTLHQGKSAFKLGTDSVLLGSWLHGNSFQRILDIGTGTGILALMMAQRFEAASILAIELDRDSWVEAQLNFQSSIWGHRINGINMDVIDWSNSYPGDKFDLIISNPPYFNNSLQNPNPKKSAARHTHHLSFTDLSKTVFTHLSLTGDFAVILPVQQFDQLVEILNDTAIYANNICAISSYHDSEIIRKMGRFSFKKQKPQSEVQFIYNRDKTRSDWYKSITTDFYIR